jgi:hypothetical protein
MNQRLEFPGGSYPDCLPTGERVVLFHGSHLETHHGVVRFPPGETFGTMFNRVTTGRCFAGLKHDGGGLAENINGVWRDVPGPFAGSSPLIYDLNGQLIHDPIVYADGSVSSQGYRYLDENGKPVTGQDTYSTPDGTINQFSVYRGVIFGQGHEGGLVVRGWDGITRLLASESPFDIRVQGIGPMVAVSFWDAQRDGLCAYVYIDTLAAFLALPPVAVSAPAPTPAPVPVPQPKPEPKPMPTVPQSEIDRAKAALATEHVLRNFGSNMDPLPYVRAAAQRLGYPWGLNGKRGDANNPSGDILAYDFPGAQPQLFDVLGDAGGANAPQFSALEYPQQAGAVFIRVEADASVPVPVPSQPPAPRGAGAQIDAELTALLTRLAALENKVAELAARPVVTPAPVSLAGQRIALKTNDGHYLCAEAGGGGEVNATREAVGGWETFTVEPQ